MAAALTHSASERASAAASCAAGDPEESAFSKYGSAHGPMCSNIRAAFRRHAGIDVAEMPGQGGHCGHRLAVDAERDGGAAAHLRIRIAERADQRVFGVRPESADAAAEFARTMALESVSAVNSGATLAWPPVHVASGRSLHRRAHLPIRHAARRLVPRRCGYRGRIPRRRASRNVMKAAMPITLKTTHADRAVCPRSMIIPRVMGRRPANPDHRLEDCPACAASPIVPRTGGRTVKILGLSSRSGSRIDAAPQDK